MNPTTLNKEKMLRHWIGVVIFFVFLTTSSMASAATNVPHVLMVYSDQQLVEYASSYLETFLSRQQLAVHTIKDSDFNPNLVHIGNDDLIILLGMEAYRATRKYSIGNPALLLFVKSSEFTTSSQQFETNSKVVPLYLDQPLERIARFARLALKTENSYTFILGPQSNKKRALIEREFKRFGIKSGFEQITKTETSIDTIEKALSRGNGVVALPDEEAYSPSNAKWLMYKAHQAGVPVIGFSSAFVRAGALAALYTTVDQILKQTEEIVSLWLSSDKNSFKLSRKDYYPKYFSVEFNDSVYRSLNSDHPTVSSVVRELREGGQFAASNK